MLFAVALTSLAALADEPQTLTGELLLEVADIDFETSTTSISFTDDALGFVALENAEAASEQGCGRLQLTGEFGDDELFRIDTADCLEEEDGGEPESVVTYGALVIRINMLNASVGLASETDIDNLVFGTNAVTSVDHFTELSTFGEVGLQGDVITVNINATNNGGCSDPQRYNWTALADNAANAANYPVNSYDRIVYVLPDGVACPWGGRAVQGGKWSWIRDYTDPHTYAHELGHNAGLGHAHGVWQCTLYDKFDRSDAMGQQYFRFNAPHLDQAGSIDPGEILNVSTSGTYTVEALHNLADGAPPRMLKIWDPVAGEFVYVSLRDPVGLYEAGMTPDIASKISIHRFLAPPSHTSDRPTRLVDALAVGDSYWLSDGTVQIQYLTDNGTTAEVEVTVHPCYMATPICHAPPPPPTGCGGTQ